jgi:hypothetical protein
MPASPAPCAASLLRSIWTTLSATQAPSPSLFTRLTGNPSEKYPLSTQLIIFDAGNGPWICSSGSLYCHPSVCCRVEGATCWPS